MDKNVVIFIISAILYVIFLLLIPFKRRKTLNKAGKIILTLKKSVDIKNILIEIICAVIIVLSFFSKYELIIKIILYACGVLGCFMISNELSLRSVYGLYENGIVFSGKYISFDEIITFPILNLPDSENYPDSQLVVSTKKYGNITLTFDSDEEGKKVREYIFKLHPEYLSHKSE